jgi:hypothetical protein
MGAKSEISWKAKGPEGERREVYVRHEGDRWLFFHRERRFDNWQPLPDPPLEDWLELLDAVERRIARRLLRPEESDRIRRTVRKRFPEAPT